MRCIEDCGRIAITTDGKCGDIECLTMEYICSEIYVYSEQEVMDKFNDHRFSKLEKEKE